MIFDKALDIFPTEIWEMIVYYLLESDFETYNFDSQALCQSINLPFNPMVHRMMKQYIPKLQLKGLESLQRDFTHPNIHYRPLYNTFYLQTKYVCSNFNYQLPINFYDGIMDEFIKLFKQCHIRESRFHFENMIDLYSEVYGDASDLIDSDDEEDDETDFKLWFTFVYAMLAAQIVPHKVMALLELTIYRMILDK